MGTIDPGIDLSVLMTEQRNAATHDIDQLATADLVRLINEQDQSVAGAVATMLAAIARAVDSIVAAIQAGGRLIYIGAGTSGRLGVLDASECPPTFNTPPDLVVGLIAGGDVALRTSIEHVEDLPDAGRSALEGIGLTSRDIVVGIAASGRTPYVLGAIAYARELGAVTIGLCNTPQSALSEAVDIPIAPVTGPEVVTGSTRLKAGTAQKLVLNMLSTATMIRLGKTFGNLMVDVQPTNAKLRVRAAGIVREATGVDEATAQRAFVDSGEDVKTAIVSLLLDVSPDEARSRLSEHGGIVRAALGTGAS